MLIGRGKKSLWGACCCVIVWKRSCPAVPQICSFTRFPARQCHCSIHAGLGQNPGTKMNVKIGDKWMVNSTQFVHYCIIDNHSFWPLRTCCTSNLSSKASLSCSQCLQELWRKPTRIAWTDEKTYGEGPNVDVNLSVLTVSSTNFTIKVVFPTPRGATHFTNHI